MARDRDVPVERTWTDRDTALWHTCEIAGDLAAGVVPAPRQQIATPFPPQFAQDEEFWGVGAYDLYEIRVLGDGSYTHQDGFLLSSSVTDVLAFHLWLYSLNSRRRARAAQDAVPRWVRIDGGAVYVSRYGMHWQTPYSLGTWAWEHISAAEVVEPGVLHVQGQSVDGPVSWLLNSDWAELVFVTWAFARHRRHPQLLAGSWLPPGWLQWCATRFPTRLASPALPLTG